CARRLLVKNGAHGDAVIKRLVEVTERIVPSHWDAQPQPFIGGVISLQAVQNLLEAQDRLQKLGGISLVSLEQCQPQSTLLTPGIIDVSQVADVPDEEYFGPLLMLMRYDSFDEALAIANNTRFGLATGLIS
ncbi:aldehyde dehydrogenase family protein, partial [Enterobacter hormaechei]|nr:aldehyde dehydrogenase family protein [Enterobacter hormaechei]